MRMRSNAPVDALPKIVQLGDVVLAALDEEEVGTEDGGDRGEDDCCGEGRGDGEKVSMTRLRAR